MIHWKDLFEKDVVDKAYEMFNFETDESMMLPSLGQDFAELESLQRDARKEREDSPDYINDRSTEDYRYFHYEEFIKQLKFKREMLEAAERLIRNPIYSFDVDTGYETSKKGAQEMIGIAKIKGSDRTGSYVTWGARVYLRNTACR